MIDYIDDQMGRVLEVLRRTGAAENTVIVVTSDHGDMLGERGLWYKMTFFERAIRVPLLIHAPGRLTPRRVSGPVSLVDLLPTLTDIAGISFEPGIPLDGASLLPAAKGRGSPTGAVYGEYLAEGTAEPIFMVRRGRFKYVASPGDPAMLFDLEKDPLELDNSPALPPWPMSKRSSLRRCPPSGMRWRSASASSRASARGGSCMRRSCKAGSELGISSPMVMRRSNTIATTGIPMESGRCAFRLPGPRRARSADPDTVAVAPQWRDIRAT